VGTNAYTSDQLLSSLKLRGFVPGTSGATRADLLRLASEECRTYIAALLKSVREEFLIAEVDVAVDASTPTLNLPQRAAGSALRSVGLLPAVGFPYTFPFAFIEMQRAPLPLTRMEPEQAWRFGASGGRPVAYMLQGAQLVLLPPPDGPYTCRIGYQARPSSIVYPDACGQVTSINPGTGQVTIDAAPSTFSNLATYDFVRGVPGFETLGMDYSASISGTTLTFSTLPVQLAVGDFVCLAGQTPIPQVPVECHDLLAARVAVKLAEASANPNLASFKSMLEEMRESVLTLISPRVTGSARKVVGWNGPGWRRRW
jgi:hypothetical protein